MPHTPAHLTQVSQGSVSTSPQAAGWQQDGARPRPRVLVSPGRLVPPPPPRPRRCEPPALPRGGSQPPGGCPPARTNMEMLFQAL